MATRYLPRSLLTSKQSLALMFSHSYTASASASAVPRASSFLYRLRPLVAVAAPSRFRCLVPGISARAFSTRQTTSSLNDQNPNWSNRPPKETILLDGCDFEHWLVVMDPPEGDITRDEIIDGYIKTLASVVGSEEEARMKIYSVSSRHYFAFGALVSEELSYKIKELPKVRWVLPDSYLDVRNKDYGGEPFINGQAVPYDPKYHEEWVRNNAQAQYRNRRNDRPRNFDRSRNFDRRGGGMHGRPSGPNPGGPGGDYGGQQNMGPQQGNAPNPGPRQPHMGGLPNNPGNYPAGNNHQYGPANNAPNHQYGPGPNSGGAPYQPGPGPNQGGFPPGPGQGQYQNAYGNTDGRSPYPNQNYPTRDSPAPPNQRYSPPQTTVNFDPNASYGNRNNNGPNMGPSQGHYENAYSQQNKNIPGRDNPPPSNY